MLSFEDVGANASHESPIRQAGILVCLRLWLQQKAEDVSEVSDEEIRQMAQAYMRRHRRADAHPGQAGAARW
jgi:hypothetical protein